MSTFNGNRTSLSKFITVFTCVPYMIMFIRTTTCTYVLLGMYTTVLSTNINYYRWGCGVKRGRDGGVAGNFLDYLFLAGHITPRYVLMYLSTFIKIVLLLGIAQFGILFGTDLINLSIRFVLKWVMKSNVNNGNCFKSINKIKMQVLTVLRKLFQCEM